MKNEHTKDWKKIKEESESMEEALLEEENHQASFDEETSTPLGASSESLNVLSHPSYIELERKLTEVEQESHKNWEASRRAMAELENMRTRTEREIANAHRFGQEKLFNALIPVLDSLDQAIQLCDSQTPSNNNDLPEDESSLQKQMHQGLALTMKLFLDVLSKHQVQQLNPIGMPFNPHEHEAMSLVETTEYEANTVIKVFQMGYKLHDRVIRPARVIVAKNSQN